MPTGMYHREKTKESKEDIKMCLNCDLPECVNCLYDRKGKKLIKATNMKKAGREVDESIFAVAEPQKPKATPQKQPPKPKPQPKPKPPKPKKKAERTPSASKMMNPSLEVEYAVSLGCVITYLLRFQDRKAITELKKARRYLDRFIRELEKEEKKNEPS